MGSKKEETTFEQQIIDQIKAINEKIAEMEASGSGDTSGLKDRVGALEERLKPRKKEDFGSWD